MEFSVKEWRKYYDQVKILGQKLKDSNPTMDKYKCYPPLITLSKEEKRSLEKEIQQLSDACSFYIDDCGIIERKPLWEYKHEDPTTWASSATFKYSHLVRLGVNRRMSACRL